jgi:hypothetical protein
MPRRPKGEVMSSRRFPPPWSIEERQACFIVKDGNGQALAYVYFEEEPGRRSAENLMSHDEAGALALNIAKLPALFGSPKHWRAEYPHLAICPVRISADTQGCICSYTQAD